MQSFLKKKGKASISYLSKFRLYCLKVFSPSYRNEEQERTISEEGKAKWEFERLIDDNLIKHKFQRPTRYS